MLIGLTLENQNNFSIEELIMDYQNHIKAIEFALEGKNEEIERLLRDRENDKYDLQIELAMYLCKVLYGESDLEGADLVDLIDNIEDNEFKAIGILVLGLYTARIFKPENVWIANNYRNELDKFKNLETLKEKKNVVENLIAFIDANSGPDEDFEIEPIDL